MKTILPLIIVLFFYLGLQAISVKTLGPAPAAELLEMDLSEADKIIVISDNKDIYHSSASYKSGTIKGTQLGFELLGYEGDIEVQDVNGNVIGGLRDGKRWVNR